MPATRVQSEFLAAMGDGARRAAEAAKAKPADYGNMDLPGGIEGGVAELRDCKLTKVAVGKTNAGKWMFYAAGIVRAPAEHNGVPIEGLRTSITENLFDTPQAQGRKTKEEHVAWVSNQLKILGVPPDMLSLDRWEEAIKTLLAIRPRVHFRFRTWKGAKQTTGQYAGREPRVNHQWGGRCAWTGAAEAAANPTVGFIDGTQTAPASANGDDHSAVPEEIATDSEATQDGNSGADEFGDIDSLIEAAGNDDAAAQRTLTEWALKAGADQDAIDNAEGWSAVADMIRGSQDGNEDSHYPVSDAEAPAQEEPEPSPDPAKGAHYGYRPLDPKRKGQRVVNPVVCEVVAVNRAKRTVDLKVVKDPKRTFKAVDWDELLSE